MFGPKLLLADDVIGSRIGSHTAHAAASGAAVEGSGLDRPDR